jgi:hypothetical protein
MITVITPFQRKENLDFLIKVLEGKCNWVILYDNPELHGIFPEWSTPIALTIPDGIESRSNYLLNTFFATADDETQYMVLCDDDSVEERFFDKIPNEDVVCVSMKRGDRDEKHLVWDDWTTKTGHYEDGIDVLTASSENMKPACVGGEQLICKGKVLKEFQYGIGDSTEILPGDYIFIMEVIEKYPPIYVPDAYVLFNYFEDGRFDSFKRKPIVLFIGDFYCAGVPAMGKSEWEGNLWASLESTELANVGRFHFDKYYYATGKKGDEALLERIVEIKPDYTVLIMYKQPSADPTVPNLETIKQLPNLITIWGDLEAEEQRELHNLLKPYCIATYGTASKVACESVGAKYMHVPKDPRVFNNPNKERDIDVLFNGSFGYGREERTEVLQYLIDNGIKLVAGGSEGADHFTTEEYADRYKRAKIAISFSRARGMDVVNARPFEAMLCGSLVLSQDSEEMKKLWDEGADYWSWRSKEELLEQIIRFQTYDMGLGISTRENGQEKTQELYSAKTFWEEVLK